MRANEGFPKLVEQELKWSKKMELPQVTLRATIAGLVIGTIVLLSNFQFGLQTGWVSMMSLPSALLGYGIFRTLPFCQSFTDVENVYVQSISVAVGTGPLAYGLVGIIPAMEKFLTKEESDLNRSIKFSFWELVIWCTGLAFFGVFFAVPLRRRVLIEENLPFPSGSATATLISVLHSTDMKDAVKNENSTDRIKDNGFLHSSEVDEVDIEDGSVDSRRPSQASLMYSNEYDQYKKSLLWTFSISAAYTLISFFFPILRSIPVFGTYLSRNYKWEFQPSPAYIGQGIIMGPLTVSYMLFGAVLGWAVLVPLSYYKKWVDGDIDDWKTGGQGWILWISLSIMISDSLVTFITVTVKAIIEAMRNAQSKKMNAENLGNMREELLLISSTNDEEEEAISYNTPSKASISADIEKNHSIDFSTSVFGMVFSSLLCVLAVRLIFKDSVPYYSIIIAIALAFFFSHLGVRALGQTDLNPVSGIGKLSQLIFALVIPNSHPARVLINLIAGGISEAGAQQAGDLMQDLKTGHLMGASPKAQFIAQIFGTAYSIIVSSVMYKIYNAVYEIPSKQFRIPTAIIWIDCSRLVTGEGLPPNVFTFSLIFGGIFGLISLVKNLVPARSKYYFYLKYLPDGVATGIGIYNTPSFTIARFLGGMMTWWWAERSAGELNVRDRKTGIIIFSSGLVLGEGLFSGLTMLLSSIGMGST